MGAGDTKIQTLPVSEQEIKSYSLTHSLSKYMPPFRKFNDFYNKNINDKNIQYVISIVQPYEEQFSLTLSVYKELEEAFREKTQKIVIENVFHDDENIDRYGYSITDDGLKKMLLVRSFKDYQSHSFGNILCEIHFLEVIQQLQCDYLHKYTNNFIIETGIESLEEPNNFIILMEPADVNLSEIITYRRSNQWEWTTDQFKRLTLDLITGLSELHAKGITHNDIRPSTIYFSVKKNCYMLSSYANCLISQGNLSTSVIKSQSYFNAPELSHQLEFDLKKVDIYSLGLSLLCAFYLYEPLDIKKYALLNNQYQKRYDILKNIQDMLAPAEQRKSAIDIKNSLGGSDYTYKNMNEFIQSLRHKNRPRAEIQAKNHMIAGSCYQRLGLWNQWKAEYDAGLEVLEPTYDENQKAEAHRQLAILEDCRGEHEGTTCVYSQLQRIKQSKPLNYLDLQAIKN